MINFFQDLASKLTASRSAVLFRRVQRADLGALVKAASRVIVNDVLYVGEASAMACQHRLPFQVSIKCFSATNPSGVKGIDEMLTPHRMVYIATCFGEIAHRTSVCFDVPTPTQYGFDPQVPVIDSYTAPLYRGNGIYPYALSYILKDLKARRITDRAYALVHPFNSASIRGLEKAGFQRLAHLKGTRILGMFIRNKSIERAEVLAIRDEKSALPIAS
jgi:RimJ/RimL family protein N-acetyltransferase